MKKTIATLLTVLTICCLASARKRSSAHSVALSAGWTAISKTDKLTSANLATNGMLNGWFIGADFTFPGLLGPVDLVPGIKFQQTFSKIGKLSVGELGEYSEQDIIADIQVPVDFCWYMSLDGVSPFIFAGPTFNFGLTSSTVKKFNEGYREQDLHYRRDTDYRPFNILIGGGLGCRFDRIRISARYDYGLINRWRGETSKFRHMNDSQITVSAAYCF